jgi:hypothetical protein
MMILTPRRILRGAARPALAACLLLASLAAARAQQPQPRPAPPASLVRDVPVFDSLAANDSKRAGVTRPDAQPAGDEPEEEEEELIKPARPSVANPAEIQKAGVLQVEYGYDGLFRSGEFRSQHAAPLSLRFAATGRLLLELDFDAVVSKTDRETRERETGAGDARLGFQVVALKDTRAQPALAFAYSAKLPTASEEKGLGTGRFDHKLALLVSKKFGKTDLDFNGALLINGREGEPGWDHGGLAAFDVSREFGEHWGLEAEVSGMSLDDALPRGLYALGAANYRVSKRLRLDWGARFGLNPAAPRFGLLGGVVFGAGGRAKH